MVVVIILLTHIRVWGAEPMFFQIMSRGSGASLVMYLRGTEESEHCDYQGLVTQVCGTEKSEQWNNQVSEKCMYYSLGI